MGREATNQTVFLWVNGGQPFQRNSATSLDREESSYYFVVTECATRDLVGPFQWHVMLQVSGEADV